MRSDHNIPDRIIDEFDRFSSLMFESGIHDFYQSMSEFMVQHRAVKASKKKQIILKGFSLQHLGLLFIIYLVIMAMAVFLFMVELAYFYIVAKANLHVAQ